MNRLNALDQPADQTPQSQALYEAFSNPSQFVPAFLQGERTLEWNGVRLYGAIDAGVSYMRHGNRYNPLVGWADSVITPTANKPRVVPAPNAMGNSVLGLKGRIPTGLDFDVIFDMRTAYNPAAMRLTDGPGSLLRNNGATSDRLTGAGDSSSAGQPFNLYAWGGVSSPMFGEFTYGRQQTLLANMVFAYDPTGGSNSFSTVGYSGRAAGGGATENVRLDNSIKYVGKLGPMRFAAMYKFGTNYPTDVRDAYQFAVGFDYDRFSADIVYAKSSGAIASSWLSPSQAANPTFTNYWGLPQSSWGTLAATASDNQALFFGARYRFDKLTVFGVYETQLSANPSHPIGAGYATLNGYTLSYVTNNAYDKPLKFHIYWTGLLYQYRPDVELMLGYYHYRQEPYYLGAPQGGCGGKNGAAQCGGSLESVSFYVDYHLTKSFDIYAGAIYSLVTGGLSSGYLHNWNIAPTLGARFRF